jgi:anion-transporting  ArsA/GET3 family ATPase
VDITDFCTQSSVLIVAGKGGVGKTTVSAALARLAARNSVSVLLVELEGSSGASAALSHQELSRNEAQPLSVGSDQGRSLLAQIRTRTLTPEDALVEYLIDHGFRRVAQHLANSGMLDVMATAIPGIRDILVLGRIAQMERAGAADLIVVDGPASGHATTFLASAKGMLDSSRAGPIRAQAADVVELVSDPARCRVVLVTLAEETPVNETVETALSLEQRVGAHLGPVVVNGLYPRLDHLAADPEAAAAAAGVVLRAGQADAMRAAAAFRRRRQDIQAEQATRLAEALRLPQLWLPHLFRDEVGLHEIDLLVDALETGLVYLRRPPGGPRWTALADPAPGNRRRARAAAGRVSPA